MPIIFFFDELELSEDIHQVDEGARRRRGISAYSGKGSRKGSDEGLVSPTAPTAHTLDATYANLHSSKDVKIAKDDDQVLYMFFSYCDVVERAPPLRYIKSFSFLFGYPRYANIC